MDSSCCDGSNSPALFAIANMLYADIPHKSINVHFDHGLGDCVHFIAFCKVLRDNYGIEIKIHCEGNKRDVFRAAGIDYCPKEGSVYHRWTYPTDFNYPETTDGDGSKLYGNILMKTEEERRKFYDEVCDLDMTGMLPSIVTDKERERVGELLKGLPEPFVLAHFWGSNLQSSKNLDNHEEIFNALLDMFDGTLILLDWDYRAKPIHHCRVRHLDRDFKLSSIPDIAELFTRADNSGGLLIGVDSGPYHLSAMHPIPALGVFHHHYPACVSLPSPKQAVMTRNAASYKPCNWVRRKRWNVLEYAGHLPSAADIARHAQRFLEGPRYAGGRADIGGDVMMQQWVRNWLRRSTGLCSRADRNVTFDFLLREITKRFLAPNIVETGCARSRDDWSAGYSTYVFAAYLHRLGQGKLYSVDNDAHNLEFAAGEIKQWEKCFFVPRYSDSLEFFRNHNEEINVLYLDSLDTEHPNHSQHAVAECRLAEKHLQDDSIIVLDDTAYKDGRWIGKGALAVPYLLNKDYKILSLGYQVVMSKI